MIHHVVLSLGSNLGDRWHHLRTAIKALGSHPGVESMACSSVYETKPVGGPPQGSFLNVVVVVTTPLTPREVLELAHTLEAAADRRREVRWGPRSLDVDVIVVDDLRRDDPILTLPHPRASQRAFVMVPWHEVDPQATVPGGAPVAQLLDNLDTSGVTRVATAQQLIERGA